MPANAELLAQIAVSKYADGLPLYRQEAIYARDQVELDRKLTQARPTGRRARSAALLSIATRPSSRNRQNDGHRLRP